MSAVRKNRILTKHQHDLLNSPNKMDAVLKQASRDKFYFRVREQIRDAVEELTKILNSDGFSETHKNLVFTERTLDPFFKAIFRYETNMKEKTKLRLLRLSQTLIDLLGGFDFARRLTPHLHQILQETTNEKGSMLGLRALYLAREWRAFHKRT